MFNKFKCFAVLFILCLVFSSTAFATHVFKELDGGLGVHHPKAVGEGDAFIFTVGGDITVEDLEVVWLDKVVPLAGQGNKAQVMLSIPLGTQEESIALLLRSSQGFRVYSALVAVRKKEFPSQSLRVDPRFVNPPESELERIKREAEKNRAIYAAITPARYWETPLQRPVRGDISSEFGVQRLFNGEPRSRHRGVDFRGAEGTNIRSVAAGKVMLAENQYYSGNVVIVDHGLGVYSVYAHMSAFNVKEGDVVKAGQSLGLVGSTGRVTGPHLHLSFMVLGQAATPERLMDGFRLSAQNRTEQKKTAPARPAKSKPEQNANSGKK